MLFHIRHIGLVRRRLGTTYTASHSVHRPPFPHNHTHTRLLAIDVRARGDGTPSAQRVGRDPGAVHRGDEDPAGRFMGLGGTWLKMICRTRCTNATNSVTPDMPRWGVVKRTAAYLVSKRNKPCSKRRAAKDLYACALGMVCMYGCVGMCVRAIARCTFLSNPAGSNRPSREGGGTSTWQATSIRRPIGGTVSACVPSAPLRRRCC